MGYKEDANKIINDLHTRFPHEIMCGEDIGRIIELSFQFSMQEDLERLAFSGKYSNGILNVIKKGGSTFEEEYFVKIKKEYAQSLDSVKDALKPFLEKMSDFVKDIFTEKYFTLSQPSMKNLSDLCSDLNYLKIYLNDLKREDKN